MYMLDRIVEYEDEVFCEILKKIKYIKSHIDADKLESDKNVKFYKDILKDLDHLYDYDHFKLYYTNNRIVKQYVFKIAIGVAAKNVNSELNRDALRYIIRLIHLDEQCFSSMEFPLNFYREIIYKDTNFLNSLKFYINHVKTQMQTQKNYVHNTEINKNVLIAIKYVTTYLTIEQLSDNNFLFLIVDYCLCFIAYLDCGEATFLSSFEKKFRFVAFLKSGLKISLEIEVLATITEKFQLHYPTCTYNLTLLTNTADLYLNKLKETYDSNSRSFLFRPDLIKIVLNIGLFVRYNFFEFNQSYNRFYQFCLNFINANLIAITREFELFNINFSATVVYNSLEIINLYLENLNEDDLIPTCEKIKPILTCLFQYYIDNSKLKTNKDHVKLKRKAYETFISLLKTLKGKFYDEYINIFENIWIEDVAKLDTEACTAVVSLYGENKKNAKLVPFTKKLVLSLHSVLEDLIAKDQYDKARSLKLLSETVEKEYKDLLIPVDIVYLIIEIVELYNDLNLIDEFLVSIVPLLNNLKDYFNKSFNRNRLRLYTGFYYRLFRDRSSNFKSFMHVWKPHIDDIMMKFETINRNELEFDLSDQILSNLLNLIKILLNYFGCSLKPYVEIIVDTQLYISAHIHVDEALQTKIKDMLNFSRSS